MCNIIYACKDKFDTQTDEYIFMYMSLEKSEIIFIKGEEDIALELARQVCESPHLELMSLITKDIMEDDNILNCKCRDVIFMASNLSVSKELLKKMREKIGQNRLRFFFIGKSRIPNGVEKMAVVEIRPKERSNISRSGGIEIEMLGPNCTELTKKCLRYKRYDRI